MTRPSTGPRDGPPATGTFAFLFTDIEGSTRLLQEHGPAVAEALQLHHELLATAVADHGGTVRRTEGDSFFATFPTAPTAVDAAADAQRRLAGASWPGGAVLQVRMGVHTGEALIDGNEVIGLDVHRAARVMSVGWGGQVLVSAATRDLLQGRGDLDLRDLGEHRLKDLAEAEHLYQLLIPGLRDEFPAVRSLDAVRNNLPTQLTAFIGREREVQEVVGRLAAARMLTLTGPGGTGKTRLALQVAAASADGFPDGVFFVALADVTDPALVMSTVAGALGLVSTGGRPPLELLADHLAERRVLLVLDNLEQVLDAAPDVSKLVDAAPHVTVLATSRAPLHVYGEHEHPVPPLSLPVPVAASVEEAAGSEAVSLFVTRASAVDPSFRLTDENVGAVVEIATRLDGLPLAIELAAARSKLLTPAAIAERLGRGLDLLASGARDRSDRQRTLRGAIAWSDDLLDGPASRLLRRFSVFSGGAWLEHVEAVCGDDLGGDPFDALGELHDHSLLRRVPGHDRPRFRMLQTIREYGAERLDEEGETARSRQRHLETYLALAEECAPHVTAEDGVRWLDDLEIELDNFRQAMAWSMEAGEVRSSLRLVSALWRLWQIRGHLYEARRTIAPVVELPGAEEFPLELAQANEAGGGIAYWQADSDAARGYYERALELYREVGDETCLARGLYNLAFAHLIGEGPRSQLFSEALATYEQLGDELGVARCHWGLSVDAYWRGDFAAVVEHTALCVPAFRARDNSFDLAWALHMQGLGELELGDPATAHGRFSEALELFRAANDLSGYHVILVDFARIAAAVGDTERAVRLFGAVDQLGARVGTRIVEAQEQVRPLRHRLEGEVDGATFARWYGEGQAFDLEEALDHAVAVTTS